MFVTAHMAAETLMYTDRAVHLRRMALDMFVTAQRR